MNLYSPANFGFLDFQGHIQCYVFKDHAEKNQCSPLALQKTPVCSLLLCSSCLRFFGVIFWQRNVMFEIFHFLRILPCLVVLRQIGLKAIENFQYWNNEASSFHLFYGSRPETFSLDFELNKGQDRDLTAFSSFVNFDSHIREATTEIKANWHAKTRLS